MRLLLILFLIFAYGLPSPARADKDVQEDTAQAVSVIGTDGAKIIVDPDDNTVRIIIDGQERAVFDAEGLHINGDINYSGAIIDGNRYSRSPADKRGPQ